MGWGSGAHGAVPHGAKSAGIVDFAGTCTTRWAGEGLVEIIVPFAGTALTRWSALGVLEGGVASDPTVKLLEMVRRVLPFKIKRHTSQLKLIRHTKPFELKRK